jgi:hypothetical protein
MAFTVELSAEIIGKVDLQHAGLGLGDGILEENAWRIGLDPGLFGV